MQKKYGCVFDACLIVEWILRFFFVLSFGAGVAWACPRFVEIFPDPTDVPDAQGEFVEIRLEDEDFSRPDSLTVSFEGKLVTRMIFPKADRLVLVHDSAFCPRSSVACGSLGSLSLPNSRESSWLLEAGNCKDSVVLAVPKPGKSFQRVKFSEKWVLTEATMGMANPQYELNLKDCGLNPIKSVMVAAYASLEISLEGCDSSWLNYRVSDLYGGKTWMDSALVRKKLVLDSLTGEAFRIQASLPFDDAPSNDSLDTLIFLPGKSPLVISEIHHCPNEPEPEWVEVYNRSADSLSLRKLRFCDRGGLWQGSLEAGGSLVFSKDTSGLRNYLSFRDVELQQVALGYLNNTSGSLAVCLGNTVLDSVYWDKSLVKCPSGFNPLTNQPENTPGYQSIRYHNANQEGILYKLSSRVIQKNRTPLVVYVECERAVTLKLLDSAGRSVWSKAVPAGSNAWWTVPGNLLNVGIAYLSLNDGKEEKIIGLLVRP